MTLLFDENLSPSLVALLKASHPGSLHIGGTGLLGRSDREVWEYARRLGLVIVSKDNDFRQLSFLLGPPPKVVWLAVGNADTRAIARLLEAHADDIRRFVETPEEGLLVLVPAGTA